MMKLFKKRITAVCMIFCMIFTLVSCGGNENQSNGLDHNTNVDKDKVQNEITLWSYYDGLEDLINQFNKEYPDIKVNFKSFEYHEYEAAYKESLMSAEGQADLFIIDSNEYGNFNSIKGLEDLSKPEYTAMKYREDFDKELWEVGKSLDKKELIGLPIASAPIVTYYRKDILEEHGFPGEPEELAEFMKDEENWLSIAKALKKDGISIFQWYSEIVKISTANMPYFDKDLKYQRDNDKFQEAVSIAIRARKLGLAAFEDIWSENGKKLLREDKLAMLYLGSWGGNEIEAIAPEQKGKWRVTTLPFGVYGWNNASIISMAENSKNKDAAWKFIEFYVFKYKDTNNIGSIPAYIPLRSDESKAFYNDFLGGQDEHKVYLESMKKTKEYPVTPLDAEAFLIWDELLNKGLEDELSKEQIMINIKVEIENRFKDTIELLKGQMEE